MLKAVRFDEDKHKELLDYIANYRDSKNRTNESEAIRFLMQLGMDSLKNSTTITYSPPTIDIDNLQKQIDELRSVYPNKRTEQPQPSINIDEIKQQISNEILSQINNQTLTNLNQLIDKLGNIQIQPVQVPTHPVQTKTESAEQQFTKINTTKPIEIPKDTNPLLANLLANANR